MLNNQTLTVILYVIPVYQLLFYSIQVFSYRRKESLSRFYFGLLLISITVFLSINLLFKLNYKHAMMWAYYLYLPTLLLVFPILNMYLLTVTGQIGNSKYNSFVNYLPSIIVFVLQVFLFGSLSYDEKLSFLYNSDINAIKINSLRINILKWSEMAIIVLVMFQIVFYGKRLSGIYALLEPNNEEKEGFPSQYIERRQLNKLFISLVVFSLSGSIIIVLKQVTLPLIVIYNVLVLFSGFTIGRIALQQINIVETKKLQYDDLELRDGKQKKPAPRQVNMIGSVESKYILNLLDNLMLSEKPYLNSQLTIDELANSLSINKRMLSNVINDEKGTNFYVYINTYRVNEFKSLIHNPKMEHLTIEGLAQKAGFNSKSSFNSFFKRVTGKTPSQYKNSIKLVS